MNALILTLVTALPVHHGSWVYPINNLPLTEGDTNALLAAVKVNHLNELYVSLRALPLTSTETPKVIAALKKSGIRIEALVSNSDVSAAINPILTYNASQPFLSRFDGLHYDHEPWIGTGSDTSWVVPLLDVYQRANATLVGTQLTLAADISAPKFDMLTLEQRTNLLTAATRLVMMAYEVSADKVQRRAANWFSSTCQPGQIQVAVRAVDFGSVACTFGSLLRSLDTQYTQVPQYAGWAAFSYNSLISPSICPGSCCQ